MNNDDISILTQDVIKKNDVSSLKQIMLYKPDMLNQSIIRYRTSSPYFHTNLITFHHPITALQYAACLLKEDCIQLLLDMKSDVNEKQHNSTPLEMVLKY